MNHRSTGEYYEETAVKMLEKNGVQILARNFRCRAGEIDIIARDEEYLVFIEVKYRNNGTSGLPEEAVNVNKQKKIVHTAKFYLCRYDQSEDIPIRFDVIAFLDKQCRWYKDAFSAYHN